MIRYDDALPKFAAVVKAAVGEKAVLSHVFLRDAAGRLTFVISGPIDGDAIAQIRLGAKELVPWVDAATSVATPEDLFDLSLGDSNAGLLEFIDHADFKGFVRVLERRIVGQDWLRGPAEPIVGAPPVVVFASHKGGVGRSTALAVASAALSRIGYNILVIDLDLEAPGLGSILLPDLPLFGMLDYFVESGVTDVDETFLENLVISSTLAENGLIHVVPAVGSQSDVNPQNVLGKDRPRLCRADTRRWDD